jgi:hypothetical protein
MQESFQIQIWLPSHRHARKALVGQTDRIVVGDVNLVRKNEFILPDKSLFVVHPVVNDRDGFYPTGSGQAPGLVLKIALPACTAEQNTRPLERLLKRVTRLAARYGQRFSVPANDSRYRELVARSCVRNR